MFRILVILLFSYVLLGNYSIAGDLTDADEKYDAGEYALAFTLFKELADDDPYAQYSVGYMYANGEGVEENKKEAMKWYMKAADQGQVDAQYYLAVMYDFGDGVAQDKVEAVKWYLKAAEQGDKGAQYYLGSIYDVGDGVVENNKEAIKWYMKAAEQGDIDAAYSLGGMYDIGDGVTEDIKEAMKWYLKAAEGGQVEAQYALGLRYDTDDRVVEDNQKAMEWYLKAAEQGQADAQNNLGAMYDVGKGVVENNKEAIKWYLKAAEQGSIDAQFNLGAMYEYGEGVEENLDIASKWYQKAADQGDLEAEKKLETIISAEIETEIKANEEENSSLEQSVVLSPVATASSGKYSAWSSKTLCRLLNDTSTSDRHKYVQEAENRGLGCVPEEFSDVVVSSVSKQVQDTSDSTEPNVNDEEEIIRRAKEKKFGLFNNPGKEITRLLAEGKALEAYYIYKYNISFFDKKEVLGDKLNSVKYFDEIRAIANYYYKSDLEDMQVAGLNAIKYKALPDIPDNWPDIRTISQYLNSIEKDMQADYVYKKLMHSTEEFWKFKESMRWISMKYGSMNSNIIRYFKKYALTSNLNFFDVYPIELPTYTINRLTKEAIKEMHEKGVITLALIAKYNKYYDFEAALGSGALLAIRNTKRISEALQDSNRSIYDVVDMAVEMDTSAVLSDLFDARGLNILTPQSIDKIPFIIKCLERVCREKDDAGVRIIVAFEQGEAGHQQVGTYSSSVKVRTGTNTVANPRYSYLTRQLDSLRREIERDRAQQQMNQQIYSPNTYDSNCTVYGNRVNCTTTQQGSDYAIGAQGGAMLGQGLNSLFGLTTKEDRYRQLSDELSRTPATVSQAAYTTQRVEMPEYEVVKTARVIIHIFDINNKQYLTLPVELKDREKWLVPNSNNVYQLPLSSSVKERLLPSNLLPNKLLKKLQLDLTKEIYRGASKLKKNEYVTPEEVLAREQLRIESDSKKIASEVTAKKTKSDTVTIGVNSDQYFEYLANDSFVKWAKSDPVLGRLFDGYLEGNETAVKLLLEKWNTKK